LNVSLESRRDASDEDAAVEWKDLVDPKSGGILYDALDSAPPPKR
jgi:hypothetical protein